MKRQQKAESCGRLLAKRVRAQPPEHEWNFDSVPDGELVTCCYWEYARESVSICDAVETAKAASANQGIPRPESEEHEAFRSAAEKAFGLLLSTGFDNSFWMGLPFPGPWQSVDKAERKKWVSVRPKIPTPVKFPPFQVTDDLIIGSMLRGEATKAYETRQALYLRLSQIDRGVANLEEAAELRNKLSEQAKLSTPVVVRGMGGVDSFIAQINWREFNDKEIVACFEQWVRENRPTTSDTKQLSPNHLPLRHSLSHQSSGGIRCRRRFDLRA
jgi:hypothetical protein